eukprot:EG_transcript_22442
MQPFRPSLPPPEGFFDNRRQDAKARNALQEFNRSLAEEERATHQKQLEELEAQYEAGQQAAAAWTRMREMGELRDMAAAQERLEAIRVRLEAHRAARSGGGAAPTPAADAAPASSDDSDDDAEAALTIFNWRQKVSRGGRTATPAPQVPSLSGAVGNALNEGDEGAGSGDEGTV